MLQRTGVWFDGSQTDGRKYLHLYPAPTEELSLLVEWVYRPTDLTIDAPTGEPEEIPEEFHPALLFYCAAVYYETSEDNPDLAQRNTEKFDLAVNELIRYGNQRSSGNGIFTIPIAGVTT